MSKKSSEKFEFWEKRLCKQIRTNKFKTRPDRTKSNQTNSDQINQIESTLNQTGANPITPPNKFGPNQTKPNRISSSQIRREPIRFVHQITVRTKSEGWIWWKTTWPRTSTSYRGSNSKRLSKSLTRFVAIAVCIYIALSINPTCITLTWNWWNQVTRLITRPDEIVHSCKCLRTVLILYLCLTTATCFLCLE